MVEVYQVRPRPQKAQELAKKDKQLEITELIRPINLIELLYLSYLLSYLS